MQKTQNPKPVPKPAPKYVPPNHLEDDFAWEFFKIFLVAGFPTLLLFYAFEVFIPFVEAAERFEQKCTEKGGFVYEFQPQQKMCVKKDIEIKIN